MEKGSGPRYVFARQTPLVPQKAQKQGGTGGARCSSPQSRSPDLTHNRSPFRCLARCRCCWWSWWLWWGLCRDGERVVVRLWPYRRAVGGVAACVRRRPGGIGVLVGPGWSDASTHVILSIRSGCTARMALVVVLWSVNLEGSLAVASWVHRIVIISIDPSSIAPPPLVLSSRLPLGFATPAQSLRFLLAHTSIPHAAIKDERFRSAWPSAFPHFPATVKIGAIDVEAMDVAGDDATEKEQAIHQRVRIRARHKEYGEGREEDIDGK